MTGRRLTCSLAITRAAMLTSIVSGTLTSRFVITLPTRTLPGALSPAMHRTTKSRSVTIPDKLPSNRLTGRLPRL